MAALRTLDPKQSRRLAIGLLLAAVLLVGAVIAIPVWLYHRHYDTSLAQTHERLERYRRIAATRPAVARQLEAMRAKDPRKFYLRSGAAALSGAEAQEIVRSIVEANGGRLISMQSLAPRDEGRYRQITVNVQLTANIFALRKILAGVETAVPYLFVDNLMVRSQVAANHRPGPGQEPEMYVSMDVHGYALTGGGS